MRKRGKNRWAIIVDLPPGPDGKRRQKWITFHGSKKDAEKERVRIVNELNNGKYNEPSSQTVQEYLLQWENIYVIPNVEESTADSYHSYITFT